MNHTTLLRNRLLVAMGLGALSLSGLSACQSTDEKDTADVIDPSDVDDDGDGMTENDGDCNDEAADVYTGAEEIANDGIDQDCDGEDRIDVDEDGYDVASDCDDSNAAINPEADEVCDGVDNNCDGIIDEDAIDQPAWYDDSDGDTFGAPSTATLACTQPEGFQQDEAALLSKGPQRHKRGPPAPTL